MCIVRGPLRWARLRLPSLAREPRHLDLNLRGKWLLPVPDSDNPVASSTAEGSIVIRNAELTTSYLSQPLRIISAQGILSPTQIAWTNASISYGKLEAQGTLEYPTVCAGSAPCAGRFSLTTPALDLGALQSTLLGTGEGGELLRQILDRIDRHHVKWPDLSGTVQIGELSAGKLVVRDATGAIDVSGNLDQDTVVEWPPCEWNDASCRRSGCLW